MSEQEKTREMLENHFTWLHPNGIKILCDFGQCENGSMLVCRKSKATICLEHAQKHMKSCNMNLDVYTRMRFEQEILDGKEWAEL